MEVYPLENMTLEAAIQKQFYITDCITRIFEGHEFLTCGDLGVVPACNKPHTTIRTEQVIAGIFHAEAALLVRGAGSAAIRYGLYSLLADGQNSCNMVPGGRNVMLGKVLIHKAPIYPTTAASLNMLGAEIVEADYNQPAEIRSVLSAHPEICAAIIQYTRQKPDDHYQMEQVIQTIRQNSDIPILTDDNYAVFKVPKIGIECGADLSCFSAFKLLGPEGIGVIAGKKRYIDRIAAESYSGGMQTQGHEALEVLRGFVYAPVSLAIQAQVGDICVARLNQGEVPGIKRAFLANAQSRVILAEFCEDIADAVLQEAEKFGAAPYPVGAESKYEVVPMFYRISGTFRADDKDLERRMIRINPMRAGADTVIRILKQAMERVVGCS